MNYEDTLDFEFENFDRNSKRYYFMSILLTLSVSLIWYQLYVAGELQYDENFGALLMSFFVSMLVSLLLIVLYIKWRIVIKKNFYAVIFFLATSNPLLIIWVVFNYETVFNKVLAV